MHAESRQNQALKVGFLIGLAVVDLVLGGRRSEYAGAANNMRIEAWTPTKEELRAEMLEMADKGEYEKAALLRDTIAQLFPPHGTS